MAVFALKHYASVRDLYAGIKSVWSGNNGVLLVRLTLFNEGNIFISIFSWLIKICLVNLGPIGRYLVSFAISKDIVYVLYVSESFEGFFTNYDCTIWIFSHSEIGSIAQYTIDVEHYEYLEKDLSVISKNGKPVQVDD